MEQKKLVAFYNVKMNETTKKGSGIYLIRSFSLAAIYHICDLFETIIGWKPEFQKLKESLCKDKDAW